MTSTPPPTPETDDAPGFLAPPSGAIPVDRCYRCGKPTAAGVAICSDCNPGKVKGPSPTQLHATILGGVALGVIGLFILWRFLSDPGGPYTATITERAIAGDGAPTIAVVVANTGERGGRATCRVTRDGAPRPDDPTYRTERIEPGEHFDFSRTVPAPPVTSPAYDLERMTVICT